MIKKKFTPVVLSLSMLLTGCGGAVSEMPGIPVISDIQETVAQAVEDIEENVSSISEGVLRLPGELIGTLTGGGRDTDKKDRDKEEKEGKDGKEDKEEPEDDGGGSDGEDGSGGDPEKEGPAGNEEASAVSGREDAVSVPGYKAVASAAGWEDGQPAAHEDPHYRRIPEHYRNRNELKELASFDYKSGKYDDLQFNTIVMIRPTGTENHYRLAGPDGEEALDYDIDPRRCQYLGCGYYVVAKSVPEGSSPLGNGDIDRNTRGLIRMEGTTVRQVLPCEYAGFEFLRPDFMLDSDALDRFIRVYTVEAPTSDKHDYLLYFTDKMFSLMPGEGDHIYNGHWDLFDLAGEAFVPGISSAKRMDSAVKTVGNGILLKKDGGYVLVDAYGNEVLQCGEHVRPGNGFIVVLKEGIYTVYDDLGNEKFSLPKSDGTELMPLGSSESGYLKKTEGGSTEILDKNGNVLFKADPAWGDLVRERDGVFVFNDSRILVSAEGKVIAEAPAKLRWLKSDSTGYFTTVPLNYSDKPERDTQWIASRAGVIAEDLEGSDTLTFNFRDEAGSHYVFDEQSFSCEKASSEKMLGPGLLVKTGADDISGLYDLFSGAVLLEPRQIVIRTVGHMILAMDDSGIITTYELLGPGLVKEEFR